MYEALRSWVPASSISRGCLCCSPASTSPAVGLHQHNTHNGCFHLTVIGLLMHMQEGGGLRSIDTFASARFEIWEFRKQLMHRTWLSLFCTRVLWLNWMFACRHSWLKLVLASCCGSFITISAVVSAGLMVLVSVMRHSLFFSVLSCRISYCTADKTQDKVFAYVSQSQFNETLECHAFLCQKKKIVSNKILITDPFFVFILV